MTNKLITVQDMKFKIDRTDPDFPVYVLGENGKTLHSITECKACFRKTLHSITEYKACFCKTLHSITECKACFLSELSGFSLNINDHDIIREAGGAVILKVDW